MKKFALVAVVLSMVAGVVGCGGSSPCDDLKQKELDCCAKISDAASKKACEDGVNQGFDAINAAGGDLDAACDAAAKSYTCTVQ